MGAPSPQPGSGAMFDRIAKRYDLLNRVLSAGLDRSWRARLVAALQPSDDQHFLDVATGTADVAMAIVRACPTAHVTGVDVSEGMLAIGREKVRHSGISDRVHLEIGDAQELAFPDRSFDGACISFGIRNVADRLRGLREMARVTRPGGRVVVLELSEPEQGAWAAIARIHVHHVVPLLGAWLSRSTEYRYLQTSIAAFPPRRAFEALMQNAGLTRVRSERLTFGVAHLFAGEVPSGTR
jgi:demethylmenaquinone methyltransferase / 2-methoxy-6-polyprenyl-1,4-benzoquinol methylase